MPYQIPAGQFQQEHPGGVIDRYIYSAGIHISHNRYRGLITDHRGGSYCADYHVFDLTTRYIADSWLATSRNYHHYEKYLRVFHFAELFGDRIIIFTETVDCTLQLWVVVNQLTDLNNHSITPRFRKILLDILNHIIHPATHGSNISPTNIYIVNNRVKFSEMYPVGDGVTQFIQMINSFFPALQMPTELAMFLIYLADNYNNLKILLEHPALLTAKERMRYRLKALDGINKDPLIKQALEIELSVMVPNMADWINNVANQHFNLTALLPYYEIMHYVDIKANKPVTPCVPKSYKNTALSFLQYNRNIGAHPPSTDEEADAVLNNFVPSFLAHLFEALARRDLYF